MLEIYNILAVLVFINLEEEGSVKFSQAMSVGVLL